MEPAGARPADPGLGRRPATRTETDEFGKRLYAKTEEPTARSSSASAQVAAARGVRARRWRWPGCWRKPVVTAPIIGATKLQHLEDARGRASVKLSAEEIAPLEEPYVPHAVVGFA